ncbi:hypothetical protein SAMN05216410_1687 [Sanguibacter gelidistatuariae]|uniref:Uncharacterized protein n=1 Tax=Sanguibacter gelidistatuariae TaxID=1814289 RepID=A0A1G6KVX8_9MICO|nr:hypothetical protein [Sanguibacter gelidistatuariae]SDC34556.1 hypothetical protein SAMN05216410_1687 [Sanguibacter gelidistatuariae]
MHDPFVEARIVARITDWARQYALLQVAASNADFVADRFLKVFKNAVDTG